MLSCWSVNYHMLTIEISDDNKTIEFQVGGDDKGNIRKMYGLIYFSSWSL